MQPEERQKRGGIRGEGERERERETREPEKGEGRSEEEEVMVVVVVRLWVSVWMCAREIREQNSERECRRVSAGKRERATRMRMCGTHGERGEREREE